MRTNFIKIIVFLFLSTAYSTVTAQVATQNIRGIVKDSDSKIPLIGATLIIENSNPLIGVTTDVDGKFIFKDLPLGRYNIIVQYLGYESQTIFNVLIGAGKEVVLEIGMVEAILKLDEVSVTAKKNKAEAINLMSTVSARSFSVEETNRYAGGLNDPSSMASSYAGVTKNASGNNDIIIRGNSPAGMLWRIEGIETPNPNHFAEEGASGGPIGILNGNILSNSDFFTGAFPAEYGNAYSGVFDINLREGNELEREYAIMASFIGLDATAEGPFVKGKDASFLINYRYSTLALITGTGILEFGGGVPEYQDLSFNVKVKTKKIGTFKLFGIGGLSNITSEDSTFTSTFGTDMGIVGLSNSINLGKKSFLKTIVAYTGTNNRGVYDLYNLRNDNKKSLYADQSFANSSFKVNTAVTTKINARTTWKTGVNFNRMFYNLESNWYNLVTEKMDTYVDKDGASNLYQGYTNIKYRLTEKLTVNAGLHAMYFQLNNKFSPEPRVGVKWNVAKNQTISLGFGIHSKVASIATYFAQDTNGVYMNKDLDFAKARHYVVGYNNQIAKNLNFNAEVYYQDLYDVPVENVEGSKASMLNSYTAYSNDDLVNKGTGDNYGIELTLEKFFANNYYFTFTTSLFESKYTAMDGEKYNTAYNGNYVINLLGGKDFKIKAKKYSRTLHVSMKASLAGGNPYNPIDLEASQITGNTEYNLDNNYKQRRDDYYKIDLKLRWIRERKRTTTSLEVEIANITNSQTLVGEYYDITTGKIVGYNQLGILPIIGYKIQF